jgi:hypothetical protein
VTVLRWLGAAAMAVSLTLPFERFPIFPQTTQGALWWYRYPLSGLGPRSPRFYLVLLLFLWPTIFLGAARLARRPALRRAVSVLEPLLLVGSLFGTCIFVGEPARGGYVMLGGVVSYGIACVASLRRATTAIETAPASNR